MVVDGDVVGTSEVLELFRFSTRCVLHYQAFEHIDRVEKVDSTPSIRVRRLEQPHVVPVVKRLAHRESSIFALLLIHRAVLLDVAIHICDDFLAAFLTDSLLVGLLEFLDHVEVVGEFVEFLLAQSRAQVDDERDWNRIENVLVQILTKLGHALNELVLSGDQGMVLKVINQVFLPVLAQEVKLNLLRRRRPLKIIQRLRRFDLNPAWTRVHHPLDHVVIVAQQEDVFVELGGFLLVEGQ